MKKKPKTIMEYIKSGKGLPSFEECEKFEDCNRGIALMGYQPKPRFGKLRPPKGTCEKDA